MIVRGLEAFPVEIGGVELPAAARLKAHRVEQAALDHLLDLPHPLLPMRREPQLLLVAPEHRGPLAHGALGEHVVQVDHLLAPIVADDDEERAVAQLDAILSCTCTDRGS